MLERWFTDIRSKIGEIGNPEDTTIVSGCETDDRICFQCAKANGYDEQGDY